MPSFGRTPRNPIIVELGRKSHADFLVLPAMEHATSLFRTSQALTFVCKRLQEVPKNEVKVLEVGIGSDFAGETLDILGMLGDLRKRYRLTCMDSNRALVMFHSFQDVFEVDSRGYDQLTPVQLRALVSVLPCIRNLTATPDNDVLGKYVKFTFDIPQEVLGAITYVVGDIATDRLPPDMIGFDAIICFHTLNYIRDDAQLRSAIQNLRSYLLPGGVLALNGLPSRANNPRRGFLAGLNRIYGPEQDVGIITEPRVFELS